MRPNLWRLAAIIALAVPLATASYAAQQMANLQPGDTLDVSCASELSGSFDPHSAHLVCAAVATTATPAEATPTPAPVSGQLCPSYVHAALTTTGPDGQSYPTWHPPADSASGCYFGHEHGDDPRTAAANPSLPAFGYVNAVAGVSEPHEGFKVFVANQGTSDNEGRAMRVDSRIVFHMGTGGPARFTTRFHSAQYDMVAPDGHYVRLQGLADTGQVGSVCDDRSIATRVVMTLPGTGCEVTSTYEIWLSTFRVLTSAGDVPAEAHIAPAVFDPITLMNPSSLTQKLFTSAYFVGDFNGCQREGYHGPVYWRNLNGSTVYQTDPYGAVVANGPLRQEVSLHNDIGIPFSQDQSQFKGRSASCAPGLGFAN